MPDDEICSLLEVEDLNAATGEEFVNTEAGEDQCTYSNADDTAAISLQLAELAEGVTAADAIASALGEQCDEGTGQEISFADADAGFGCVAEGVPVVGAASDDAGLLAVLTGVTLDPSISDEQVIQALAGILDDALGEG